jgi:hypothetical protein
MKFDFEPEKLHPVVFAPDIGANLPDEMLVAQVRYNMKRRLPQAKPHLANNETVALVCGGPSLAQTEKELVKEVWRGAKIITVNAAYQWCIDKNLKPSAQIMIDGRAFNSRMVETPIEGCHYLLAGQCHPDTFDKCRDRKVTIWHACSCQNELDMLNSYYFGKCFQVTDGTTVGVRAIALLRMLGFQSFHVFGLDSCWLDDAHHAYQQVENDEELRFPVWLRPRERDDLAERFICSAWHVKQATDFMALIKRHGNTFRLNVKGPGLIAAIMRIAAQVGLENVETSTPPEKET